MGALRATKMFSSEFRLSAVKFDRQLAASEYAPELRMLSE